MSKQFRNFLLKIMTLSTLIVLVFNVWQNLINANNSEENIVTNSANDLNFKKSNTKSLWKTAVAITTNIWIRYNQRTNTPATIYKDIFSVSEVMKNSNNFNDEIIWKNMVITEEYKNVLKTDVKQLIDSSYDKPRTLNAFIEQLEFRYTLWVENIKNLNQQKTTFEAEITSINSNIESLKQKISKDFSNKNEEETLKNIDNYLELKKNYYYARTYIIYINHFLAEYNKLSNYNKLLLDTLINNKDAIIKDVFVVIPDSGSDLLKEFNLIYDESEIKN